MAPGPGIEPRPSSYADGALPVELPWKRVAVGILISAQLDLNQRGDFSQRLITIY